jgi:hypothetical protein
MGVKYGCPVEDIITGLAIQCRGWASVYFNPQRKAFLGLAPTTLAQTLLQHRRFGEGNFSILRATSPFCCRGTARCCLGMDRSSCRCSWATASTVYGLQARCLRCTTSSSRHLASSRASLCSRGYGDSDALLFCLLLGPS